MAEAATFNIYFSDSNGSSGGGGGTISPGVPTAPQPVGEPNQQDPTNPKDAVRTFAGLAIAKQIGSSILNQVTSHVGEVTGSSDAQAKVSLAMRGIGTATMIAVNPAMGISMTALNLATKAWEAAQKAQNEKRQVQQTRERAGPSFNKSRVG